MKIKLTIAILFTLIAQQLSAQTQLPKGVYMSFEEIKNGAPSADFNLTVEERSQGDIIMIGGNDFKLISEDKLVKKKVIKKEIVGYSDGNNFFINCFPLKCQMFYAKATDISSGKLNFEAAASTSKAVMTNTLGGGIAGAAGATKRYNYELDLNTGEVSALGKVEK